MSLFCILMSSVSDVVAVLMSLVTSWTFVDSFGLFCIVLCFVLCLFCCWSFCTKVLVWSNDVAVMGSRWQLVTWNIPAAEDHNLLLFCVLSTVLELVVHVVWTGFGHLWMFLETVVKQFGTCRPCMSVELTWTFVDVLGTVFPWSLNFSGTCCGLLWNFFCLRSQCTCLVSVLGVAVPVDSLGPVGFRD